MTPLRATVLALAVGGSAACGVGGCGFAGDGNDAAHLGTWSVSRVLAGTPDGRSAVGTTAEFGASEARFGSGTCTSPTYARRWLAASAFADAYGVAPQELGLPGEGEIALVDIECAGGGLAAGGMLIVGPGDRLVAAGDGAFYELTRQ
jgi:hypothetical protein